MNILDKLERMAEWYRWNDAALWRGLRSVFDAERLYDYWHEQHPALPHLADGHACGYRNVDCAAHRVEALGYDPMIPSAILPHASWRRSASRRSLA
jgi:hypothetical protein